MSTIYITFEEYLRQQLSPNKKLKFEQELFDDSEKKESFEAYKLLRQQVQNKFLLTKEKQEVKNALSLLGDKYFVGQQSTNTSDASHSPIKTSKAKPILRKYIMSIAASFLMLMAIGFGLKQYANANYSHMVLAETMDIPGSRSISNVISDDQQIINAALVSLQSKDYSQAVTLLSQIDGNSSKYNLSQWLMAKSYLLNKEIPKAKSILYDLSSRENNFQNESSRLIEKLESTMHRISTF